MSFWRQVAVLVAKDLRIELRSREIVYTMAFFAAMVVLVFSFVFSAGEGGPEVVPGILLIAVAFSGTLGLSRAFDREREADTLRGLLLAPVSRTSVFTGKVIEICLLMIAVELVVVLMVAFFFAAPVGARPLPLALLLLLSTVGFALVGTVFAAMLLRSQSRDLLLPVVLYPVLVPLFIAASKGIGALLWPVPDLAIAWFWIKFLVAHDLIFAVVAGFAFETVVVE